jgi:putative ABC transport system substrate-binding protein
LNRRANARYWHLADITLATSKLVQLKASALIISGGPFFVSHREQLAALTLRHAVPASPRIASSPRQGPNELWIGYFRFVSAGWRLHRADSQGRKPAELPVQQAEKVELYINLKTAKALGLTVPQTLLARAEAVIE